MSDQTILLLRACARQQEQTPTTLRPWVLLGECALGLELGDASVTILEAWHWLGVAVGLAVDDPVESSEQLTKAMASYDTDRARNAYDMAAGRALLAANPRIKLAEPFAETTSANGSRWLDYRANGREYRVEEWQPTIWSVGASRGHSLRNGTREELTYLASPLSRTDALRLVAALIDFDARHP